MVRGRKNPGYERFPSRLRKALRSAGQGQTVPAARSTLAGWEQGLRVPRIDAVEQVSYALGLSPAFLAFGIEADSCQPAEGLRCAGVASRLRQIRTARGLTVLALATAAGLSHSAVRSTETESSIPSIATVEAFAIALGVSPGWLAYGLGPVELRRRRRVAASPAPSPNTV